MRLLSSAFSLSHFSLSLSLCTCFALFATCCLCCARACVSRSTEASRLVVCKLRAPLPTLTPTPMTKLRLRSSSDAAQLTCVSLPNVPQTLPLLFPPAALGLRLTKLHATVATATNTSATMRQF